MQPVTRAELKEELALTRSDLRAEMQAMGGELRSELAKGLERFGFMHNDLVIEMRAGFRQIHEEMASFESRVTKTLDAFGAQAAQHVLKTKSNDRKFKDMRFIFEDHEKRIQALEHRRRPRKS